MRSKIKILLSLFQKASSYFKLLAKLILEKVTILQLFIIHNVLFPKLKYVSVNGRR
jgi:hypothetical protein